METTEVVEASVVRVAGAASLTEVLTTIGAAFEAAGHPHVELRFGGSSTLARQIAEGAPTDVFVSADPRWVEELVTTSGADAATRRTFATNRLVAVVPGTANSTAADLAALVALPHLALAGPEIPAGMHARAALERAGLTEVATPHVVSAADVRAALAWAASGEADAAIVYATDARIEPRVRVAFELDASTHDPIRYEAVVTAADGRDAPATTEAAAFVTFLAGESARAVLDEAGFGPAP